jgi:iron(III) transport system ATP-binding protein
MADLRVAGLTKAFGGHPVLRGVDLVVPSGQFLAILGASGSGKTTLLRLICGFDRADGGSIDIGGRAVSGDGLHVPAERRHIGYVAQEGALFPHLSVADNIVFGLPRHQRRAHHRVGELLAMVGLPAAYAARAPQTLSGGEQQRVALARALAAGPSLVLLDEPFSALDAAAREGTRTAVAAALSAARATGLLVTVDQTEALSLGQSVAVLRDGRLAQVATPELLYRQPADAALASFVGESVLLPGVTRGGRGRCALGDLALAADPGDGVFDLMLRPEQIRLSAPGTPATARGRVCGVTFYGHDARVRLTLDDARTVVTAFVPGHMKPRVGDVVGIAVEGPVMAYPRSPPPPAAT